MSDRKDDPLAALRKISRMQDLNDPDLIPQDIEYSPGLQQQVVDRLLASAGDAVYEMKSLFGVNHRTAERWISGVNHMPLHLVLKLSWALNQLDDAQARLEALSNEDRTFLQIASTRVKLEPLAR